jgi:alkylhydroperoxidase family enzyme
MLRWLIRRRIAAFERKYDYDASYGHDILAADLRAALAFNRFSAMAQYRRDIPADAVTAAALVATMTEDCGPCTQLVVTKAERSGVPAPVIRAVIAGDERQMSDPAKLAFRFAKATLAHDPEADALRQEVEQRWGKRALISLAFAITAGRVYPTVKYALGHGKTCQRLTVGGVVTPVLKQAA